MTTPRAYVAACAYAHLVVVGAAAGVGGVDLAARVAVAGLAILANLAVAHGIHTRFVRAAATGADPASVGHLVLKQLTTLPLALLLVRALGADAVAAGLGCLALGALAHAVAQALRASDARLVALGMEA